MACPAAGQKKPNDLCSRTPDRPVERYFLFFHKKDTAFSAKINSKYEKKQKKHVRRLKTDWDDAKFHN